jgi:nitrate reductase NapE
LPERASSNRATAPAGSAKPAEHTKGEELRSFLFLTVVMAPVVTGLLIAGYGFLVWMYQVVAGPPTGG